MSSCNHIIPIREDSEILVVDDNLADRVIMQHVLSESRLANEVSFIDGGSAIIEHMEQVVTGQQLMPALILMDVNMPRITGFEVLSRIRSMPSFLEAPVIAMLSSSEAEADKRRAKELGANDFLVKQSGLAAYIDLIDSRFQSYVPELSAGVISAGVTHIS